MKESNTTSTRATADASRPIRRRKFLKATGAGAITAAFAGCTGNGDGNGGGNGDGGNGGTDGGGGTTTGQTMSGPIKIGLLAPLRNISLGRSYEQAGLLLEKQINDGGGLLGADVEVIIKDSEYNASTAREKYRELILQDEVDVTFGIIGSESMQVIFDEIASNQQIFITSGTGDVEFSKRIHDDYDRYKYIFRSHQAGVTQGLNLARIHEKLAQDEGITSVALLQEDIQGYAANGEVFRANIPDGVSIEVDEKFAAGTEDYRPLLEQASRADVDFTWMWSSQTGATMINQWSRMQPNFGLGGVAISATDPNFGKNVEGAESFLGMIPGCVATYQPTELTTQFQEQHMEMFDELPPFYTGYTTYDAIWTWVQAVREAGTIEVDPVITALEENEFEGTQGVVDYLGPDEDADNDDPQFPHDPRYGEDYVIPPGYQWRTVDGEPTQVITWPPKFAEGSYEWPEWVSR
ncbi:ABC transporter substrate-binding protein [Haladaptatus sp. ZSTT2]|uniref:ABC transporter substrate-binding protein n=1 Tax=Haladaptatus sp. ZSTT2 TaxID=3120515 RepID=UPI00300EA3F7